MPGFQAELWEWIARVWAVRFPDVAFRVANISKRTKVPPPALHRIQNGEGDTKDETIAKIAKGLGVEPPTVRKSLVYYDIRETPRSAVLAAIAQLYRALDLLAIEGRPNLYPGLTLWRVSREAHSGAGFSLMLA